jgi:hypothetical protein
VSPFAIRRILLAERPACGRRFAVTLSGLPCAGLLGISCASIADAQRLDERRQPLPSPVPQNGPEKLANKPGNKLGN